MTLSDLTRCALCDTPDTCGRAGRCSLTTAAAMDKLIAADADLIAPGATGDAMLATVRPGPVLHIWRGGQEVAAVPLTQPAALRLAAWLLQSVAEGRP